MGRRGTLGLRGAARGETCMDASWVLVLIWKPIISKVCHKDPSALMPVWYMAMAKCHLISTAKVCWPQAIFECPLCGTLSWV